MEILVIQISIFVLSIFISLLFLYVRSQLLYFSIRFSARLWEELFGFQRIKIKNVDIYEISEKLEELLQYIKNSQWKLRIIRILWDTKTKILAKEIIQICLVEIYRIIIELRNRLIVELRKQQQSLKSTKSEVKMNITWTTELNQVSELQRARLDRQIEQFEELQRVLMKV